MGNPCVLFSQFLEDSHSSDNGVVSRDDVNEAYQKYNKGENWARESYPVGTIARNLHGLMPVDGSCYWLGSQSGALQHRNRPNTSSLRGTRGTETRNSVNMEQF